MPLIFYSLSGCSATFPRPIDIELSIISVVLVEWWLFVIFFMLEILDISGHLLSIFSTWKAIGGTCSWFGICLPSLPWQKALALSRICFSFSASILFLFYDAYIIMSFKDRSFSLRSSRSAGRCFWFFSALWPCLLLALNIDMSWLLLCPLLLLLFR